MTQTSKPSRLCFEHALLSDGWQTNVCLEIASDGVVARIEKANRGESLIKGICVPGMANLHSHAFQRAMSGFTERHKFEHGASPTTSAASPSNFWSWREAMYTLALKLSPPQIRAIASQLYIELLKGGFTSVAEFHYLHHDIDGKPYANVNTLAHCIVDAAQISGISLRLLPVLYSHSGFGSAASLPEQKRFIQSSKQYLDQLQQLVSLQSKDISKNTPPKFEIGVAFHSLRAVSEQDMREVIAATAEISPACPIHIHIAEQVGEVEACIAQNNMRPVTWLFENFEINSRWCLVHATHLDQTERELIAESGSVVGLCPTTEANLGDGIFPGYEFLSAKSNSVSDTVNCPFNWGIGTDSHVGVNAVHELRSYEYSQRLLYRIRNVAADRRRSTATNLFEQALTGGRLATGRASHKIAPGYLADLVVLDANHYLFNGVDEDYWLDRWMFCDHHYSNPVRDVYVSGRLLIQNGRHVKETEVLESFQSTMKDIWRS